MYFSLTFASVKKTYNVKDKVTYNLEQNYLHGFIICAMRPPVAASCMLFFRPYPLLIKHASTNVFSKKRILMYLGCSLVSIQGEGLGKKKVAERKLVRYGRRKLRILFSSSYMFVPLSLCSYVYRALAHGVNHTGAVVSSL